jgi:DnaA-homolog protein
VSLDRTRQLALRFPIEQRCTLQSFEAGPNAELVGALARGVAAAGSFDALWLVGESGSGKSHLLHGACHAATAFGRTAAYLPPSVMIGGVGALDGLDEFDVVAIDELERWIGERAWEEALLRVYQSLAARGGRYIVASRRRPHDIEFALPDLASRLRAAQVFAIAPLADADRARAIERLAAQRGLELGADVVSFLLRRAPRRMNELVAAFDRLDRGAWAQQRRITVPLAKDVLGL